MTFLAKDGYIDTPAFIELVRDIDKMAQAEGLKPTELYFSKKAIVRIDHPSAAKLDAAAFEKKRAQPIKMRKRAPTSGSAVRMMVLLRNYKGLENYPDYYKDYQMALKAIERHNTKAEKSLTALKNAANAKRDKMNAAFDKNIDCFINDILGNDAVEGEDYVVGNSMMGKTLLVRLPNKGVVSIGKADLERFNKAVEAMDEEKPAAKPKARTGQTMRGTKTARGAKPEARPARGAKPAAKPARGAKPVAATRSSRGATTAKPARGTATRQSRSR